jgi:hypothetical protein
MKARGGHRILATWFTLLGSAVLCASAIAAESAPDFTGTWRMQLAPDASGKIVPPAAPGAGPPPMVIAAMPLLRPDVAARLRAAGQSADRGYCAPPRFTGAVGYAVLPVAKLFIGFEILASPGRLTMLDETGLIRRLYLRDAPPANALDESNSGNSIARFEGRTLVVRTTGLNPETVTIKGVPGTALGRNAQVLERITLVGPDLLEIVTTVTAPELYAAPVVTTNRYRRDSGMLLELTFCSESDRSYDAATGAERFEAKPPPDLPPPPK